MSDSIEALMIESEILPDWDDHNKEVEMCITTRQMQRETRDKPSSKRLAEKKADKVKTGRNLASSIEMIPDLNVKPPSPNIILASITTWIGKQLLNQEISKTLKSQIITSYERYPDGLMTIPSAKEGGTPRIIVPVHVQKDLILQAHSDIHHQNHSKVYKLLSPLYYWPSMTKDIEETCKACELCLAEKMRREKLQSLFDLNAPLSKAAPRQHYGIDFYGLMSGKILIMVDLFTREALSMVTLKGTKQCSENHFAAHYF
jgi:hypothetical protein